MKSEPGRGISLSAFDLPPPLGLASDAGSALCAFTALAAATATPAVAALTAALFRKFRRSIPLPDDFSLMVFLLVMSAFLKSGHQAAIQLQQPRRQLVDVIPYLLIESKLMPPYDPHK
jgi:hypothetical protein